MPQYTLTIQDHQSSSFIAIKMDEEELMGFLAATSRGNTPADRMLARRLSALMQFASVDQSHLLSLPLCLKCDLPFQPEGFRSGLCGACSKHAEAHE